MNATLVSQRVLHLCNLVAIGLFACITAGAHATVIASDTFSVTDTRTAGSALAGSQTETGNLTWATSASSGTQWAINGNTTNGYVGTSSSANGSLAVPFDFSTYSSMGDVATVSFSVAWREQSSSWFGIGFSSNSTGSNITSSGSIWLKIDVAADTWTLYSNGNSQLATGDLSLVGVTFSTATSVAYTYSLSYDSNTNTVTDLTINGTSVVSSLALSSSPGSIASVAFFGQKPYNTATGTEIDNFQLSMTASAIPEPGTVALLIGSASLVCAILRKKLRK